MKQSPLNVVKQGFASKAKLVEAVRALATEDLWIDRVSSVKGLGRVANAKLLRLHTLLSDAKARFGSRAKLIGAILEIEKRGKDEGWRQRLEGLPLPRLLDLHGAASRRASRAKSPGAPPAPKEGKAAREKPAAANAKKGAPKEKQASKAAKAAPAKKTSKLPGGKKTAPKKSKS